jgi:Beta-lactamase/Domain of unknown function (DUF3471)
MGTELQALLDTTLAAIFPANEPGAAVIVMRDGETVYRNGFGMANLELGVPIQPDMVFRIASVTKQFTAVAILLLMEQGKLALDDPITRFLPDYPVHDQHITVEHLLTHTSGIPNYTDMKEWLPLWRKDFALQELIDLFKDQPMQFPPGTRWAYSNSGYGWGIGEYEGFSTVEHDGGIHGFTCNTLRIPAQRIYVAVLTNRDNASASPALVSLQVAGLVLDRPYHEPQAIALDAKALERYAGIYRMEGGDEIAIALTGSELSAQFGPTRRTLAATSPREFFVREWPLQRFVFGHGELTIARRFGMGKVGRRVRL